MWKKYVIPALTAAMLAALSGCGSEAAASTAAQPSSAAPSQSTTAAVPASDTALRDLKPVSQQNVSIEFDQYYTDEGNLVLEITKGLDAVKSVHFLLFLELDDNQDKFLYLGEDNNMEGDFSTGVFKDNFNGYWASIDDTVVTLETIEEADEYTLYSIPCIIDGTETSIRARYDYASSSYRILGRYDGVDKGDGTQMTSRGVRKIENGAQVIFTFTSVEGENYDEYEYQMDPITWSDDLVMEDTDLGDGIFLYMYEVEDVFGNELDADPVEIEVKGDDITWLTDLE